MLRRAGVRPLATVSRHGPRRQTTGMEFGAALGYAVRSSPSSLDQLLGLHSRCSLPLAADEGRRLSAPRAVSRPLAGHPPRTCFACPRPLRFAKGANSGGCLLARCATRD